MAIQIINQPADISPTGNPMLFRVEDSNINATFFRVTIKRADTDEILGISKVFKAPLEDGNFVDIARRLKDYTSIEVDNSSAVFESLSGAVNYYVLFESVDNSGNVLSTAISPNKWAISGGGDILNGYNYDMTDWYMNVAQIGVKYADFLTSKPEISDIFLFQKEMLYFLADENSGVDRFEIRVYNKNGSIIQTISEPIDVTAEGELLHRLFVQPNLLATIYDFDVTQLHRMEVALYSDSIRVSKIRTYIVDEDYDCAYDKVNILWENYEGGIDTYTFINPREIKNVSRQTMRLNGYSESINNVFENLSQVVSSTVESTYRLTTLGLSDEVYKSLSNMIGTENAYVELGDGSLWGIVLDNTSVEVKRRKYETSLLRFDLQFKSIPNLDLINRGSVLIEDDLMPNPIVFTPVTEAEFNTQYTSETVMITGINVTVPISVTGGEYRVNNGVWTTNPSIVNNGDTVTVRTTTAQASEYTYTVVLTVGEGQGIYTVTTKQILDVPDTISFTSLMNTELNTTQTSNLVTITGINVPISISVSSGSYSKNGGAFSTTPTTAVNGDTFRVRHTSAGVGLTNTTTVFNYGGKTTNFITSTREYDIIPDDFTFTNVQNAPVNSEQLSNIITVNGITDPIGISITNGSYRINGGSWVNTSGSVVNGDTVQLRLYAPANAGQSVSTTLTIGSKSAIWSVDTTAPNLIPDPFDFAPNVTGATRGSYVNSNIITISGINVGSPISITAGSAFTQYRINGGTWTNANGTVFNGDTVQLRIQTSSSYSSTRNTTISIGGVTDTWSVTSEAEPNMTLFANVTPVNNFRVTITFSLFPFPTLAILNQNLTISGNLNFRDASNMIKSVPFSVTMPSGNNQYTSPSIDLYDNMHGNPRFGFSGVTTNPANSVNTTDGYRKLILEL